MLMTGIVSFIHNISSYFWGEKNLISFLDEGNVLWEVEMHVCSKIFCIL